MRSSATFLLAASVLLALPGRRAAQDGEAGTPPTPGPPGSTPAQPLNASASAELSGTAHEETFIESVDFDCPLPPKEGDMKADEWVTHGGFVLVVGGAALSFWGLAEITEGFFVPSLSVVAERVGMSPAIAGATLLASAANSPELFASFVSLFVTHSQLGAGTIIGSAAFNHLTICACAILASPGGELQLDTCSSLRDCVFYAITLLLLLYAFGVVVEVPALNLRMGIGHPCKGWIHIYWYQALVLLLAYSGYVVCCVLQKRIVPACCISQAAGELAGIADGESGGGAEMAVPGPPSTVRAAGSRGLFSCWNPFATYRTLWEAPDPADLGTGATTDVVRREPASVSMWVHKQSRFYAGGVMISARAWQRRWITIDEHGMRTCRHPGRPDQHIRVYNLFEARKVEVVDPAAHIIQVHTPHWRYGEARGKHAYRGIVTFRAPSLDALRALVIALNLRRASFTELAAAERRARWASALDAPRTLWGPMDGVGDVSVTLPRPAKGGEWGLELDSKTLRLTSVSADCAAGRNDRLRSCEGMILSGINDAAIRDSAGVARELAAAGAIATFRFRPPSDGGHDAKAEDETRSPPRSAASCPPPTPPPDSPLSDAPEPPARPPEMALAGCLPRAACLPLPTTPHSLRDPSEADDEAARAGDEREVAAVPAWLHWLGWLVVWPLRALITATTPDVRRGGNPWLGAAMCTAWLAALSFLMTICLELIGGMLGIPAVVMGLTVGAAGTSFPNAYASLLVARQGLSDMAVSNALGSNVFTALVGLGLPWISVCYFGESPQVDYNLHMYHGMPSRGSVFPIIILFVFLSTYSAILCWTGGKLRTPHAYCFLAMYTAFVLWAAGTKCAAPPPF